MAPAPLSDQRLYCGIGPRRIGLLPATFADGLSAAGATNPYPAGLHNPEAPAGPGFLQGFENGGDDTENAPFPLGIQPEDNNPAIEFLGRIGANAREVSIEGHQCPLLTLADVRYFRVGTSVQALVENARRVVPRLLEKTRDLSRQVLVNLEPHVSAHRPKARTRSCESSAA